MKWRTLAITSVIAASLSCTEPVIVDSYWQGGSNFATGLEANVRAVFVVAQETASGEHCGIDIDQLTFEHWGPLSDAGIFEIVDTDTWKDEREDDCILVVDTTLRGDGAGPTRITVDTGYGGVSTRVFFHEPTELAVSSWGYPGISVLRGLTPMLDVYATNTDGTPLDNLATTSDLVPTNQFGVVYDHNLFSFPASFYHDKDSITFRAQDIDGLEIEFPIRHVYQQQIIGIRFFEVTESWWGGRSIDEVIQLAQLKRLQWHTLESPLVLPADDWNWEASRRVIAAPVDVAGDPVWTGARSVSYQPPSYPTVELKPHGYRAGFGVGGEFFDGGTEWLELRGYTPGSTFLEASWEGRTNRLEIIVEN